MRVLSLTIGTRGDLEIAIQLATALAARGHEVTIAASPFYSDRVTDAGFGFEPIGDGGLDELRSLFGELSQIRDRSERIRGYAERWLRPQLAVSWPSISALLPDFDVSVNNLRLFERGAARPTALITYDPPSDPRRYGSVKSPPHVLELVALDRALVDPGQQWPDHFRFAGFFAPDYAGADPPAEQADRLDEFLGDGDAPVVLTMGSMTCVDPEVLRSKILEACRIAGRRLVTVAAWAEISDAQTDDSLTVRQAPYDRVFAAALCVVHHGGCGTVISALRAGRPSILLPQITSQATFAGLLDAQNLSAGAFDTADLDPRSLAEAIGRCEADPTIRDACRDWRDRLVDRDGAAVAAELIERHAGQFE